MLFPERACLVPRSLDVRRELQAKLQATESAALQELLERSGQLERALEWAQEEADQQRLLFDQNNLEIGTLKAECGVMRKVRACTVLKWPAKLVLGRGRLLTLPVVVLLGVVVLPPLFDPSARLAGCAWLVLLCFVQELSEEKAARAQLHGEHAALTSELVAAQEQAAAAQEDAAALCQALQASTSMAQAAEKEGHALRMHIDQTQAELQRCRHELEATKMAMEAETQTLLDVGAGWGGGVAAGGAGICLLHGHQGSPARSLPESGQAAVCPLVAVWLKCCWLEWLNAGAGAQQGIQQRPAAAAGGAGDRAPQGPTGGSRRRGACCQHPLTDAV